MRSLIKEAYGYAILLVILFAIAALAVSQTLSSLHELKLDPDDFNAVAASIWSLTLGFMLIAGSFGLWAIQFSAGAASRRRIAAVVESMDYLKDGLLVVDRKGRIIAMNPPAGHLMNGEVRHLPLSEVFRELSEEDVKNLLHSKDPAELEHLCETAHGSRALRFRSQPSAGVTLVLISDVTVAAAQLRRNRQVARLLLIGQIARGVAHDFNNILCAISGHSSLLERLPIGSPEFDTSMRAITQGVERGSALATHLLELARPATVGDAVLVDQDFLQMVCETLRNSLPLGWKVTAQGEAIPPVSLSNLQIEQVLLNVGIHTAELQQAPGTLQLVAATPSSRSFLLRAEHRYAGVLLLSASNLSQLMDSPGDFALHSVADSGVIMSVIATMVDEAGGAIQLLTRPGGVSIYRILLPGAGASGSAAVANATRYSGDLETRIKGWSILFASSPSKHREAEESLNRLQAQCRKVESIPALFGEISGTRSYHVIILDKSTLGTETEGVLRAVLRLAPGAGIVVLGEDPAAAGEMASAVTMLPAKPDRQAMLMAVIESRSQAAQRKTAAA